MKVRFKIRNEKGKIKEVIVFLKDERHLNNYKNALIKNNCLIFKETHI